MIEIINFVELYYIWFIIAGIVILLAVIGYYADKTNFWQNNVDENEDGENLKNIGILDYAKAEAVNSNDNKNNVELNISEEIAPKIVDNSPVVLQNQIPSENVEYTNNINFEKEQKNNIESINHKVSVLNENQIIKFENEFNSVLPEKELITSDLLEDIDELKLDKTQKINLGDIKNLEDIELPNINGVEEEEIWKF